MKNFFVLLLAAAAMSLVVGQQVYSESELAEWNAFKTTHGRNFDAAEDTRRLKIYMDNKARIEAHNARHAAGQESYRMAINHFADRLSEEIPRGYRPQP